MMSEAKLPDTYRLRLKTVEPVEQLYQNVVAVRLSAAEAVRLYWSLQDLLADRLDAEIDDTINELLR